MYLDTYIWQTKYCRAVEKYHFFTNSAKSVDYPSIWEITVYPTYTTQNSKCIVDPHVKCKITNLKDTVFVEEYLYSIQLCGRERSFKPNLKDNLKRNDKMY